MSFIHHSKHGSYTRPRAHQADQLHTGKKGGSLQFSMSGLGPKTEDFRITEMGEMETDASSTHNKSGVFERYVQPCVAEMFGTTAFVFVGCASVMGSLGTSGVLQPAVAHGLTLGVMIALFGQIR